MMKTLIFIMLTVTLMGQKHYPTDSLEAMLDHADDSLRAVLLYKIAKNDYNNNPSKCIRYAEEAAAIAEKRGDSTLEAMAYQIVGVICKNQGDFERAMTFQLRAATILENRGDKKMLAPSYNDLGILNKNLGNYSKAIEYYRKSLSIILEAGNDKVSALLLNNIGTIFDAWNESDSAEYYYLKALAINIQTGYEHGMALTYNNLGELYAKKKNFRKAAEYFEKTLEIDIREGNKIGMTYSYLNLANAQTGLQRYADAAYTFRAAKELATETESAPLLGKVYLGWSNLFEKQERFRESLALFKQYKELEDSVFSAGKIKQIEELQARFEMKQKNKEIELLSKESEIGNLIIARQRNRISALTMGIGLVLVLAVSLVILYKQRHKAEVQAERIKQKEQSLKAVFSAQEEERKRIAKDLHDGIGQLLSGVKLSWEGLAAHLRNQLPGEVLRLEKLSQAVDEACVEVRTISHRMMPRLLGEFGLIPSIRDMLDKSLGNTNMVYSFEHFGATGRYDETVEIALYRITQELVNNVIKHSGASKVAVQLIRNAGFLILIVEDNGKGFDKTKHGSGIGLLNIASRVDTVHGDVNYQPSPGSGTVATVRVPMKNG